MPAAVLTAVAITTYAIGENLEQCVVRTALRRRPIVVTPTFAGLKTTNSVIFQVFVHKI